MPHAHLAAATALMIGLAGCSTPYATPAIEPAGAGFAGIAMQEPLTLIATHGMCAHTHGVAPPDDWPMRRAATIAAALGAPAPAGPVLEREYAVADGGGVLRRDIMIGEGDGAVRGVFLVWGAHTAAHKAALDYDNLRGPAGGQPLRPSLNHDLRSELVNRCLLDAVVYLGPNGDGWRTNMQAALCDAVGGRFGGDGQCAPGDDAAPVRLALMGESLGSTVMFDAFAALSRTPGPSAARQALAGLGAIYMISNQTPLLDRASAPLDDLQGGSLESLGAAGAVAGAADGGGSLERFLDAVARSRGEGVGLLAETAPPPVDLVALTDPADLLSFRLPVDPPSQRFAGLNVVNVLVSNGPTRFGTIADPLRAHQGYETNPAVARLIAHGQLPGGPGS